MTADAGDTAATGGPEAGASRLVDEIEATRHEMSETVHAIGEKLDPANVIEGAKGTVREATLGKVEQMAMGAQETWDDVRRGNGSGILETLTQNPVPTAMVAIGLGLLFMRRGGSSRPMREYRYDAGRFDGYEDWRRRRDLGYGDRASVGTGTGASDERGVRSAVTERASEVRDRFGDVAQQAGETASRIAGDLSEGASDVPDRAAAFIDAGGSQAGRLFDENPLAVGVVAVAAGAAASMLLPITQPEREMLGPAREKVFDEAASRLDRAMGEVEEHATEATGRSTSA